MINIKKIEKILFFISPFVIILGLILCVLLRNYDVIALILFAIFAIFGVELAFIASNYDKFEEKIEKFVHKK